MQCSLSASAVTAICNHSHEPALHELTHWLCLHSREGQPPPILPWLSPEPSTVLAHGRSPAQPYGELWKRQSIRGEEGWEKGRTVPGWSGDLQYSEACAAGGRGPPICSPPDLTLPYPIPPEPSFPLSPPLWKSVGDRTFFFSYRRFVACSPSPLPMASAIVLTTSSVSNKHMFIVNP